MTISATLLETNSSLMRPTGSGGTAETETLSVASEETSSW